MPTTTRTYLDEQAARGAAPDPEVLVRRFLADARHAGASELHLEPWDDALEVRLRVNGVLTELVSLPTGLREPLAQRFKVMADLARQEIGLPWEGRVPANPELGGVELLVALFPTVRGDKISVRFLDRTSRTFDLSQLGYEERTLDGLLHLLSRPSGLVLITGPTGSGRTTAAYASLNYLVGRHGTDASVATIEDLVESRLPRVSQTELLPAQGLTYPVALRGLLRQDPDAVYIGELRDAETAGLAVAAAMADRLVLSTLAGGAATDVFARLRSFGLEPYPVATAVSGVLNQRLVRVNCPDCAQPYDPDPGLLETLSPQVVDVARFHRGAGCESCLGTGFGGRTAVTELLMVTGVFREALLRGIPGRELADLAIEEGMETIWQSGLRRVIKGQTPLEELARVVAIDQL